MEQVVTQNPALLQWFENSALPKNLPLGSPSLRTLGSAWLLSLEGRRRLAPGWSATQPNLVQKKPIVLSSNVRNIGSLAIAGTKLPQQSSVRWNFGWKPSKVIHDATPRWRAGPRKTTDLRRQS